MNHEKRYAGRNFFDLYSNEIAPRLEEIDVLMKSGCVDISLLAQALSVPRAELRRIMSRNRLERITRKNLHIILSEGSSELCRIYRREVERGSPLVYTRDDISYIYGLDSRRVDEACDRLGVKETTEYFLPQIFKLIPAL